MGAKTAVSIPLIAIGVGVLALGGVGGLLVYRWWNTAPPSPIKVEVDAPVVRLDIPLPKVKFTNITPQCGVRFRHHNGVSGRKLLPETMGSGVAVIDYNGDGKPDLLFVNSCDWPGAPPSASPPTLALYRNNGNGTFTDVTKETGLAVTLYGMGVAVGDYDNDGWPDLFITAVGKCRLFHNEGGKGFRDVTDEAGVGGGKDLPAMTREQFLALKERIPFGSSATFVDYDGDGKLDLFVCNYVSWSPDFDLHIDATLNGSVRAFVPPTQFEGAQCALYRNKGDGTFQDVSAEAGIRVFQPQGSGPEAKQRDLGKSLGVVVCDPDEDGWPDLIVANDMVRNFFFHNEAGPDGRRVFVERGEFSGVAYAEAKARGGMGIDWAEFRPGRWACVIANFSTEPSTFLCLDKPKSLLFADEALAVGLAGPSRVPLKFGTFFFDYDLDGRLDLLTCNGHLEPDIAQMLASQQYAQPAQLFWNTGLAERRFEPVTPAAAGPDLFQPLVGRGSAYLDLDGDGDLDVVLTANNGPAVVLRNDQALGHHWVRLQLEGDGKRSNRSAIGAVVTLEAGGVARRAQVTGGRGYLSQSELTLTFGLGELKQIDKVTIRWPGRDAGTQVLTDLAVDKLHVIKQGS
jgi:enediyne biosynthesis protein E4